MKRFWLAVVFWGVFMAPQLFAQVYPIDWALADTSYFSLLVGGGGYTTAFTLTNLKNFETQVALFFCRPDGWPLEGTFQDGSIRGPASQFTAILPPNSSRQISFTLAGGQTDEYAFALVPLTSTGEKSATVSSQYSFAPSGSVIGQATVVPMYPVAGFGFYAESSSGSGQDAIETGLALVNPGSVPATVSMTLNGTSGTAVGSCGPISIPPYSQVVGYVKELCQLTNQYYGLVKVQSDVSIVGVAMLTTSSVSGVYSYSTVSVDPLPAK
jgi:hypothetical protein